MMSEWTVKTRGMMVNCGRVMLGTSIAQSSHPQDQEQEQDPPAFFPREINHARSTCMAHVIPPPSGISNLILRNTPVNPH
jgi:hypothetical protein